MNHNTLVLIKEAEHTISLGGIFRRFKGRIVFTLFFSILESFCELLFPLFIGYCINDALGGRITGFYHLGFLGGASLLFGSGRRFFDTRIYAEIFSRVSAELVKRDREAGMRVSRTNGRITLFSEIVNFFEDDFPSILGYLVALGGSLVILAMTDVRIFTAALAALTLILIVYGLSTPASIRFNREYNNHLERQVDRLSGTRPQYRGYFRDLMRWKVKLSDLETLTFSVIWIFMIGVLIYSVRLSVGDGSIRYGTVFSTVMYVYGFIESSAVLPFYYQQIVRLQEISGRLKSS